MIQEIPQRVIDARNEWAAGDAIRDAGLVEPATIKKYRDIVYSVAGGEELLLDVYIPENAEGLLPVIVNIHGGGYFYGDKELYRFYCMNLAERGFGVVNFNYRLSPIHHFPAPLEDANAVMSWITANGADYKLDAKKVFVVGDSAGAQLTSQYSMIYSNSEYAKRFGFEVPDITIKGIGLACGLYDLRLHYNTEAESDLFSDYFGEATIDDPRMPDYNAIDQNYPPTYIFSSYYDFLRDDVKPFYDYLISKGIKAEMKIYGTEKDKELTHVFHVNLKLSEGRKANDDQTDFFKSLM